MPIFFIGWEEKSIPPKKNRILNEVCEENQIRIRTSAQRDTSSSVGV